MLFNRLVFAYKKTAMEGLPRWWQGARSRDVNN